MTNAQQEIIIQLIAQFKKEVVARPRITLTQIRERLSVWRDHAIKFHGITEFQAAMYLVIDQSIWDMKRKAAVDNALSEMLNLCAHTETEEAQREAVTKTALNTADALTDTPKDIYLALAVLMTPPAPAEPTETQKAADYVNTFRYAASSEQLARFQNKVKKALKAKLASALTALVDGELICREWCESNNDLLEGQATFQC